MNQLENIYKHDLMDHARNPRNYGLKQDCPLRSVRHNPSCGDVVQICGYVDQESIKQLFFEASGCVLSKAMASKLTEYVAGKDFEQILSFDEKTVEKLLNMELGINRLQCGMLSVLALQQAIVEYRSLKKNA
ncbi:iron-sulfur cluster assembly scaffold protein [Candidatus Babeliales bacterium]|nr:iron-sulfur cluster assembly scaffold protein [Candidatus Babeliales bacterium]